MLQKLKTYFDCSGCGLCALVCPVWTQQADIALTPWGRAKSLQGGATPVEIKASVDSCLSCGACHGVCPENIDVHTEELKLRASVGSTALSPVPVASATLPQFFPSSELRARVEWHAKLERALSRHQRRAEIVTDHPTWHKKLLTERKQKNVFGLGEWILRKNLVRAKIEAGDLYWMDAALFHNAYEKLVGPYDRFRKKTGCALNWNLQRTAMPLGVENDFFERKKQYDWVMFRRDVKRIVVEGVADWAWLKENSPLPVVHVAELLE